MGSKKLVTNKYVGKVFGVLAFALVFTGGILAQQGALDTTFGLSSSGIYQDALPALPTGSSPGDRSRGFGASEILADGKIIAAGNVTLAYINNNGNGGYASDFLVRRLNADGSVDNTFGSNGEARTTFYRWGPGLYERSNNPTYVMKVQPSDGKIILASSCSVSGTIVPGGTSLGNDLCLVRYNANGTLDTSFGGNTVFSYGGNPNYPGNNNTMDPGKVFTLTGTNFSNPAISLGSGGTPVKIQIASDGRIYVFGNSRDDIAGGTSNGGGRAKGFVAVYSSSGALQNITSLIDTSGNSTAGWGEVQIYDGDLLSNGDFIAVGSNRILVSSNPAVFSQHRWRIYTGSSGGGFLDSDVNSGGRACSLTMLRGNKILIGGQTNGAGFGSPTLVRYNGNLTVDTTFGVNGRTLYDGNPNLSIDLRYIASLKTQPDGKILGTTQGGNIVRFNPDGSLDRSFARDREDVADALNRRGLLPWGRYTTPFPVVGGSDQRIGYGGISIRPNGQIVGAGNVGGDYTTSRATVVQLKTSLRSGGTFSDLNNDGKAEIAVYRPTGGVWHSLDSFSGSYSPVQFGNSTDKIAPADFDGDGQADRTVFRDGTWYIFQSSNNQPRIFQWGSAGDLPRPGDFNGDGQADFAVFRPSNGTWYIYYSNPIQPGNIAYNIVQFGANGDIPILADIDGDGKSDITVFRNGVWYFIRSSNGSIGIVQFGSLGDLPVAGDYDGDGKADLAVFRSGVWYVLRSTDGGATIFGWGQAGDRPVPGDYDNDGKNDFAIYRSGIWWILRTSDGGYSLTSFGLSTDTPIQTAYIQ